MEVADDGRRALVAGDRYMVVAKGDCYAFVTCSGCWRRMWLLAVEGDGGCS